MYCLSVKRKTSPAAFRAAGPARALLQVGADRRELGRKFGSQARQGRDNRDRDQRRNQSIFDSRGAGLIRKERLNHRVAPF